MKQAASVVQKSNTTKSIWNLWGLFSSSPIADSASVKPPQPAPKPSNVSNNQAYVNVTREGKEEQDIILEDPEIDAKIHAEENGSQQVQFLWDEEQDSKSN